MQFDKLELDLRPRPNAQALDLGFSLLRAHAGAAYLAWLALWLPLIALCYALACWLPHYGGWFMLLPWWLRPLLERAPLYVLSRQVFGEHVGWRDAVKAWPRQLGGGWFSLLTWLRPFASGRGLYQPIWQLEGARGKVAAERRRILGRNGTARSAYWFGIACGHFEAILQFGMIAFIGIFVANENHVNPIAYMVEVGSKPENWHYLLLYFGSYAFSGGVVGPIFTACGFTLYLNRRATLEAWDIEIVLRQIHPPVRIADASNAAAGIVKPVPRTVQLVALLGVGLLCATLLQPHSVMAEEQHGKCEVPAFVKAREATHQADQNAEQKQLHGELSRLYDQDDLRGYVCEEEWQVKNPPEMPKKQKLDRRPPVNFAALANILEVVMIATCLGLIAWLLYRYRDQLATLVRPRTARRATEIAGLDIRPESLPDDVPARVAQLWQQGERRAALALLYRATLSRLVNEDGLILNQGATEGDCRRVAERAFRDQRLEAGRLAATVSATDLWIRAAYAGRWPDDAAVAAGCVDWKREFGVARPAVQVTL